jgi:hypothetical protein
VFYMVYGETGRYPLAVDVKVRMVSYWCKLVTGQCSSLSCKVYAALLDLHSSKRLCLPWITCIEQLLNEAGFGQVFLSNDFPNTEWLKRAFRLRLQDQYIQHWNSLVQLHQKVYL